MKRQIKGNISEEDYKRLVEIKEKYSFKSTYQIVQYLIRCFLRVADPKNDGIEEEIPDEIKEMFGELEQTNQDLTQTKKI